jgi:hypothetical protein
MTVNLMVDYQAEPTSKEKDQDGMMYEVRGTYGHQGYTPGAGTTS